MSCLVSYQCLFPTCKIRAKYFLQNQSCTILSASAAHLNAYVWNIFSTVFTPVFMVLKNREKASPETTMVKTESGMCIEFMKIKLRFKGNNFWKKAFDSHPYYFPDIEVVPPILRPLTSPNIKRSIMGLFAFTCYSLQSEFLILDWFAIIPKTNK